MQAFSEIFFNEFMAEKFGILVQNDILTQCNTEPFSRREQFQQFRTRSTGFSWSAALQAAPSATACRLTYSFSKTYNHARRSLDAATYRFIFS